MRICKLCGIEYEGNYCPNCHNIDDQFHFTTKIIVSLLFLILFMGSVHAGTPQSPDDYFKLGQIIDYKKNCINNGAYCSDTAACNITSYYPNGSLMIGNKLMSNNGYYYNYTFQTFNSCNDYCGIYRIDISCYDGGKNGTQTFYAEVNPTGIKPSDQRTSTTGRAIWIIFGIAIMLFVAFLLIQNNAAKYSLLVFSMIMLVTSINLIFASLYQEVTDPSIINLFDFISAASYYFYWLAGGLICIILILTAFNSVFERYKNVKLVKYGGERKSDVW